MTELQGLPNTVAGFGLAFLQLRKAGRSASNAVLGIPYLRLGERQGHRRFHVTEPLRPEVDKVVRIPGAVRLGNERDRAAVRRVGGDTAGSRRRFHTGSPRTKSLVGTPSDAASISSRSYQPLRGVAALCERPRRRKRWVLWQIPRSGNSNSKNV
jgi:hypothetical protein